MGSLFDGYERRRATALPTTSWRGAAMFGFLRLFSFAVVGLLAAIRAVEEALAAWVRRSSRSRDLSGLSWA
jgi:hypothetical protein